MAGFNFSISNITSAVQFERDADNKQIGSLNTYEKDRDPELLTYPIDLGSTDKSHYMIFTIFEQEVSQFKGSPGSVSSGFMGSGNKISQGQVDASTLQSQGVSPNAGQSINDGVSVGSDIANYAIGQTGSYVSDLGSKLENIDAAKQAIKMGESFIKAGVTPLQDQLKKVDVGNFNRRIQKIKETVALYLPDTLAFDYRQGYSDVNTYDGKFGLGAVAASAVKEMTTAIGYQNSAQRISEITGKNLSPFISRILSKVGGGGKVLASTVLGGVENPMLELLYTTPEFRSFNFDFMFYPKSVAESKEVYKIINCFKFHSSPEIKPGSAGFFLVPPSIFNIEFYYNGRKNPNLPNLSDCVCTGVSVDYAPSGWAAYEVPPQVSVPEIGGTGSPFAVRLSLNFKETVILTKGLYYKDGSYLRNNR